VAGVEAQGAGLALRVPGWRDRQAEGPAGLMVQGFNLGPDLGEVAADAADAVAQAGGEDAISGAAAAAGSKFFSM
jgi:hypothetical protein